MKDISKHIVSGFKWETILKMLQQAVSFIVNIIIIRFLMPEDYGLVSLVAVVMNILLVVVDMGLNTAIIQKKNIDRGHLSTAFFINMGVGVVLFALIQVLSPVIGEYYKKPQMVPYLKTFSVVFIIRAASSVQVALTGRELNFKKSTIINMISVFLGTIVKIILAYLGYGVWSIIYGEIVSQICITIMFWIDTDFHISIYEVNGRYFRDIFRFGINVMLINLLTIVSQQIDMMVIGRILPSVKVGLYSIAFSISTGLPAHINSITQKVMFPAFLTFQDDDKGISESYFKLIKFLGLVSLPICAGIIFVIPEFTSIALKDKWMPAVPIIQILCIYAMSNSLGGILWGQLLKAKGHIRTVIWMTCIRLCSMIVFILIGAQWGLLGIAWSITIYGWIFRFLYQGVVNRIIYADMGNFMQSVLPSIVATGIMSIGLMFLKRLLILVELPELAIMLATILFGISIYVAAVYILYKKDFLALWHSIGVLFNNGQ